MKIKVYSLIWLSTDNYTYADYVYCGTFSSRKAAQEKADSDSIDDKEQYEIREEVIEGPFEKA